MGERQISEGDKTGGRAREGAGEGAWAQREGAGDYDRGLKGAGIGARGSVKERGLGEGE